MVIVYELIFSSFLSKTKGVDVSERCENKLDKRQAKAIALTIFTDIDAYIQAHPEAYQAFLKEEMEAQQNEKSA